MSLLEDSNITFQDILDPFALSLFLKFVRVSKIVVSHIIERNHATDHQFPEEVVSGQLATYIIKEILMYKQDISPTEKQYPTIFDEYKILSYNAKKVVYNFIISFCFHAEKDQKIINNVMNRIIPKSIRFPLSEEEKKVAIEKVKNLDIELADIDKRIAEFSSQVKFQENRFSKILSLKEQLLNYVYSKNNIEIITIIDNAKKNIEEIDLELAKIEEGKILVEPISGRTRTKDDLLISRRNILQRLEFPIKVEDDAEEKRLSSEIKNLIHATENFVYVPVEIVFGNPEEKETIVITDKHVIFSFNPSTDLSSSTFSSFIPTLIEKRKKWYINRTIETHEKTLGGELMDVFNELKREDLIDLFPHVHIENKMSEIVKVDDKFLRFSRNISSLFADVREEKGEWIIPVERKKIVQGLINKVKFVYVNVEKERKIEDIGDEDVLMKDTRVTFDKYLSHNFTTVRIDSIPASSRCVIVVPKNSTISDKIEREYKKPVIDRGISKYVSSNFDMYFISDKYAYDYAVFLGLREVKDVVTYAGGYYLVRDSESNISRLKLLFGKDTFKSFSKNGDAFKIPAPLLIKKLSGLSDIDSSEVYIIFTFKHISKGQRKMLGRFGAEFFPLNKVKLTYENYLKYIEHVKKPNSEVDSYRVERYIHLTFVKKIPEDEFKGFKEIKGVVILSPKEATIPEGEFLDYEKKSTAAKNEVRIILIFNSSISGKVKERLFSINEKMGFIGQNKVEMSEKEYEQFKNSYTPFSYEDDDVYERMFSDFLAGGGVSGIKKEDIEESKLHELIEPSILFESGIEINYVKNVFGELEMVSSLRQEASLDYIISIEKMLEQKHSITTPKGKKLFYEAKKIASMKSLLSSPLGLFLSFYHVLKIVNKNSRIEEILEFLLKNTRDVELLIEYETFTAPSEKIAILDRGVLAKIEQLTSEEYFKKCGKKLQIYQYSITENKIEIHYDYDTKEIGDYESVITNNEEAVKIFSGVKTRLVDIVTLLKEEHVKKDVHKKDQAPESPSDDEISEFENMIRTKNLSYKYFTPDLLNDKKYHDLAFFVQYARLNKINPLYNNRKELFYQIRNELRTRETFNQRTQEYFKQQNSNLIDTVISESQDYFDSFIDFNEKSYGEGGYDEQSEKDEPSYTDPDGRPRKKKISSKGSEMVVELESMRRLIHDASTYSDGREVVIYASGEDKYKYFDEQSVYTSDELKKIGKSIGIHDILMKNFNNLKNKVDFKHSYLGALEELYYDNLKFKKPRAIADVISKVTTSEHREEVKLMLANNYYNQLTNYANNHPEIKITRMKGKLYVGQKKNILMTFSPDVRLHVLENLKRKKVQQKDIYEKNLKIGRVYKDVLYKKEELTPVEVLTFMSGIGNVKYIKGIQELSSKINERVTVLKNTLERIDKDLKEAIKDAYDEKSLYRITDLETELFHQSRKYRKSEIKRNGTERNLYPPYMIPVSDLNINKYDKKILNDIIIKYAKKLLKIEEFTKEKNETAEFIKNIDQKTVEELRDFCKKRKIVGKNFVNLDIAVLNQRRKKYSQALIDFSDMITNMSKEYKTLEKASQERMINFCDTSIIKMMTAYENLQISTSIGNSTPLNIFTFSFTQREGIKSEKVINYKSKTKNVKEMKRIFEHTATTYTKYLKSISKMNDERIEELKNTMKDIKFRGDQIEKSNNIIMSLIGNKEEAALGGGRIFVDNTLIGFFQYVEELAEQLSDYRHVTVYLTKPENTKFIINRVEYTRLPDLYITIKKLKIDEKTNPIFLLNQKKMLVESQIESLISIPKIRDNVEKKVRGRALKEVKIYNDVPKDTIMDQITSFHRSIEAGIAIKKRIYSAESLSEKQLNESKTIVTNEYKKYLTQKLTAVKKETVSNFFKESLSKVLSIAISLVDWCEVDNSLEDMDLDKSIDIFFEENGADILDTNRSSKSLESYIEETKGDIKNVINELNILVIRYGGEISIKNEEGKVIYENHSECKHKILVQQKIDEIKKFNSYSVEWKDENSFLSNRFSAEMYMQCIDKYRIKVRPEVLNNAVEKIWEEVQNVDKMCYFI